MLRQKKKVLQNVTIEKAQAAASLFAEASNKLAKIEARMNERINSIKAEYLEEITELSETKEDQMEVLEVYATEQKSGWGKKKSFQLLHCTIGFRTSNPSVSKEKKFTWDAVLELMKKNKIFKPFIREKEELNKEAILAEKNESILKKLHEQCYVKVVQDESFYVEAKNEEVAA